MPLTLKINLGNDIRRVTVHSLTLLDLQNLVQKLFGESLPSRYTLKYRDDENDLVTVSSEIELQEAVSSSKGILKFSIVVQEEARQNQSGPNQFGDVLENVFKRIAEINPLLFQVIQQWIDEFTENKQEAPSTPSCASRCNSNNNCQEKESEVVHPAVCDHCQQSIRGVRYKCTTCPDYDLCSQCLPLREKVHPEHKFWVIQKPFGFCGRRGPCGRPPVHAAVCDSCDARIVGIRHKCKECPDYDLCSQCFQIQQEVHPGHSFETIERPSFPFGGRGPFGGPFGGPRGCPFMARRCQRDNAPQQPAPQSEPAKEEPKEPATPQPAETPVSSPAPTPSPASTPQQPRTEVSPEPTPAPVKAPEVTPSPVPSPVSSTPEQPKADTESVEFKLSQLAEMGFTERERNLNLLVKHRGNLVNVIRDLLN